MRGGGHNPAGHCVCDDGLVIDLSLMTRVDVDPDARVARVAGRRDLARLRPRDAGARPRHPGRRGRHDRRHRAHPRRRDRSPDLAARPHLRRPPRRRAHDVGRRDASAPGADGDEELLWGLRGGGGNFGIATEIELRLHPLERVLGGRLVFMGDGVEGRAPGLPRRRRLGARTTSAAAPSSSPTRTPSRC